MDGARDQHYPLAFGEQFLRLGPAGLPRIGQLLLDGEIPVEMPRLATFLLALHATEIASTIVLLVPSLNPDGVDIVTRWYRKTLGTPFEGSQPPELWHKYVGHD